MPANYFEEFITRDADKPRCLGVRVLDANSDNRPLGFAGRRDITIVEPLTLQKGHRAITYKASAKRPIEVFTMLQRLEGLR